MPAAWAGLAVTAGTTIAGAVGGGSSISSGQSQANAAAQQAIATGTTNYSGDQANAAPYISTGQSALMQYANLTGANGPTAAANSLANFQASPGYGYQVQQGLKAVDNGAASNGLLRSGATLKAEQTLGSNLANQDFTNYLGRLNSLAGLGLQGAGLDNQSTGTFDNLLNSQTNSIAGTDTAAAGAQAGLTNSAINGVGNALNTGLGYAQKNGLFELGTTGTTSTDAAGNVAHYDQAPATVST